jgi:hypothetical protein
MCAVDLSCSFAAGFFCFQVLGGSASSTAGAGLAVMAASLKHPQQLRLISGGR